MLEKGHPSVTVEAIHNVIDSSERLFNDQRPQDVFVGDNTEEEKTVRIEHRCCDAISN
jgi:hypothetical protein